MEENLTSFHYSSAKANTISSENEPDNDQQSKNSSFSEAGGVKDENLSPVPSRRLHLRIYQPNNTYHTVSCKDNITVATLRLILNAKLSSGDATETLRLYVKERGKGMVFAFFVLFEGLF